MIQSRETFDLFEREALHIHNEYRRDHGVPPLQLDSEICIFSRKRAEKLARDEKTSYSSNGKYGENIYSGFPENKSVRNTAKACIDSWYDEINEYSFGTETDVLKCRNFSQIIWKSSKLLGVGMARSSAGKVYIVANYFPPGNRSSEFVDNLPPPGALEFSRLDSLSLKGPETSVSSCDADFRHLKLNVELLNDLHLSDVGSFKSECLQRHNFYRQKHGVKALSLNSELCFYAREWAESLLKTGIMEHRKDSEYGENIFFAWSSDGSFEIPGGRPVDKWYSEVKDYVFDKEPSVLKTGHFTQVIWEDSVELGVGFARSGGNIYVVANYNPPGNIIGSYRQKVHPPLY